MRFLSKTLSLNLMNCSVRPTATKFMDRLIKSPPKKESTISTFSMDDLVSDRWKAGLYLTKSEFKP